MSDDSVLVEDYSHHPDWPLIHWISGKIITAIPKITTEFWANEYDEDQAKKMNAEMDLHFAEYDIELANNNLGEDMQTDEGDALRSHINKTVDKSMDRHIANRKREARKNSSGEPNDQGSMPTENGRSSKNKSKKKKHSTARGSNKRSSNESAGGNDNEHNQRSRSRPRNDDCSDTTSSNNQNRGRPKSILRNNSRKRSVSFGRSTTPDPPRSNYTEEGSTHRSRGSNRTHGKQPGRGGRGGSRGGRGGRGGKRS